MLIFKVSGYKLKVMYLQQQKYTFFKKVSHCLFYIMSKPSFSEESLNNENTWQHHKLNDQVSAGSKCKRGFKMAIPTSGFKRFYAISAAILKLKIRTGE